MSNNLSELRAVTFRFRQDKEGNRRAPVELSLAVPNAEGLIEIISNGGKPLELLTDILTDYIRDQASPVVAANEGVTQENFPHAEVEFSYLANLNKVDRRSATITPELWAAFAQDYVAAMVALTGKDESRVALAADILLKKFAPVKGVKSIISALKTNVTMYAETPNAAEYEAIITYLVRRADALLAADNGELTADML